jgi:RimJ/RimL family protein N-acetyltransferase
MNVYRTEHVAPERVSDMKRAHRSQLAAALDGMWESFAAAAGHYLVFRDDAVAGYCVINDDHKLLEFHAPHAHDARAMFRHVLETLEVSGAFVATCQPAYLSLCLDHQREVTIQALMYQATPGATPEADALPNGWAFSLAEADAHEALVEFGATTLGADRAWLRGYYGELIARGELWQLRHEGRAIATGECRASVTFPGHADLGVVVGEDFRGRGLATNILRRLAAYCSSEALAPICSTERGNPAAQRAIVAAGFFCPHRLVEVTFGEAALPNE